jgi:hypothetical protein
MGDIKQWLGNKINLKSLVIGIVIGLICGSLITDMPSFEQRIYNLVFSDTSIQLGMSQGEVAKKLEKRGYRLIVNEKNELLTNVSICAGDDCPGQLHFLKDKLIYAYKKWDSFEGDKFFDLGKTLFLVFSSLQEREKNLRADVSIDTKQSLRLNDYKITLSFNDRKHIEISTFEVKPWDKWSRFVTIGEIISSPEYFRLMKSGK